MNRITLFIIGIVLISCNSKVRNNIQTTLVKRGVFTEELVEEGVLKAVKSTNIIAPNISWRLGNLKITNMVSDGNEVDQGDTVIIFDPSDIKKAIISSEQTLDVLKAEHEKLEATQKSEIEDLESDLEIARISLEISRINLEQSLYNSEMERKEDSLKLVSAKIALDRAREQIENKKKIQKEELFQKMLNIKQESIALEDANRSYKTLFVVSPSPGIALITNNWMTRQKWQVGDQPYQRTVLIELPDLNKMMAEIEVNEVDITKVSKDMKVEVRLDSYSDTIFTGKVISVANLAQDKDSKSKIKIFPVQILVDGTSKSLLPGLTVSCRIITNELQDVLYIPIGSVFKDQDGEFVYTKTGNGFKRKNIKIGNENTDYVVVLEGVEEGDELSLTDPFLNKEEENGEKSSFVSSL